MTNEDLRPEYDLSELKGGVEDLRADMNANFTLLKWMVGVLIPLAIGVLVRLLFFRIP